MITKANTSTVPHAPEGVCSVLISINTPGIESPVCRLGNSKVLLGELTVGQLIDKVINPNSLLSVGVPMAQLEAESPAAVAISELLSTDLCEVFLLGEGEAEMEVSLIAIACTNPGRMAQVGDWLEQSGGGVR